MAETVKPTISQRMQASEDRDALVHNLDDLFERYLNLLHEYQIVRRELAKHLSSGFLSLAQANFSNPNRFRYGQDLYDQRMQASCHMYDLFDEIIISHLHDSDDTVGIPNATEAENEKGSVPGFSRDSPKVDEVAESQCGSKDPLRWFGVLSPPALRSSQQEFKSAVEESVPQLANIVNDMESLEIEVKRTRKKLSKIQ